MPADDETGITKTYGSKWPERLGNKCGEMLGEFGEDEMHAAFVAGESLFEKFCVEDCTEDGIELRQEDFSKKLKMKEGEEAVFKKPKDLEGEDLLERASPEPSRTVTAPVEDKQEEQGLTSDPPATHTEL